MVSERACCSAGHTEVGKVREHNEDAFLDCPAQGLWVVADGMGGYERGAMASQLIVTSLADLPVTLSLDERIKAVRQCLHWINRRLSQELTVTEGHSERIMGSTVVALMLEGSRAACIWAGDSRCYLWRERRLYQLSRDHSLQQQLIEQQQMSAEQASAHPSANALTQAVGARAQLTLDMLEFTVYPGDTLLLCSDGLYQALECETLGSALSRSTPHMALKRLFEAALCGSAQDNLTAVVIRR